MSPRKLQSAASRSMRAVGIGTTAVLATVVLSLGCSSPDHDGNGQVGAEAQPLTRAQLRGAARDWNLVLISVDTLRADRLNSYGYQQRTTSTAIDELSEHGLRFLQASAPRASTWPSLATVLTGLYPSGHGVVQNPQGFSDQQPTLPRILQAEGYNNGAFLSNMCSANHSGWETRECSANSNDERLLDNVESWLGRIAPTRQTAAGETTLGETTAGGVPAAPVFLWTHFFGAHGPYYNGGALGQEIDPGYNGMVKPKRGVLNRIMTDGIALDERDREHLDAIYDAAVIGTDRRIGRLLETIGRHLDLERTIIVFLSDHGEELYQHNQYLYHACSVYQTTLHVPLTIVAPGLVPAGATVEQPVELSDLLPTLLDLLGIEQWPQCIHGESLLPYVAQPERSGEGKLALSEYGTAPISTVRRGQWKLVENPDQIRQQCLPDTTEDFYIIGQTELYDLAADPGETQNLAAQQPERAASLSAAAKKRREALCRTDFTFDGSQLTEEEIRQMEALGYVVQ